MLVLDTDHLSILLRGGHSAGQLEARLVAANQEPAITIITVHEALQGWLAELNKSSRDARRQIILYQKLQELITLFPDWYLLPFDRAAAAQIQDLGRHLYP